VSKKKWYGGASYVLLNDSSHRAALVEKINKDSQRPGLLELGKAVYSLEPLKQSYFNASNKMTYMRMRNPFFIKMGILACALILFMASFNFISLFLLSMQARRKEAGVKKMLGISGWSLMRASSLEVALYVVVAFAFAITLISFLLPSFNSITEGSLALAYLSRVEVLLWVGGIVFALGITVVLFSMAHQRKVRPVELLKNVSTSKVAFSKMLFTIQFIVSITLAICAITIIDQMNFLRNEPLGFNRNILRMQSPGKKINDRLVSLKQSLLRIKGIEHASITTGNPISGNWTARYDLQDGKFYTPYLFSGDEDLFSTLNLTLVEGELPSATRMGKVVNEKLVKYFHMNHPIGEKIPGTDDQIIGVVKDFTCTSFKEEIQPAIVSYSVGNSRLLIDYSGQPLSSLLPQIQDAWKNIFPDYIFTYQVIQEELMKKYKEETFFYKTVVTFAITTMVISCFGLFALSWAVTQSRTKEMGIRKVLGATANDVMNLLTMNFLRRIAIAFLIAAPFGYYLMNEWLSHFARRISVDAKIFAFAGATVLLIALTTMSLQTLRAARTNPVKELKND
jgi:putative ABC transport system permease protein